MKHVARAELLSVGFRAAWILTGKVLVVALVGLLHHVEVIEEPEEFIETVHGWQGEVVVAEMVLAELARGIPGGFHDFAEAGGFGLQSQRIPGLTYRRHA